MVDLSEFCNTPEKQTLMMMPSHYSPFAFCFAKLLIPSLSKQREDANDANGNVRSPLQTPTIQFV
jgi:hypothetical protein